MTAKKGRRFAEGPPLPGEGGGYGNRFVPRLGNTVVKPGRDVGSLLSSELEGGHERGLGLEEVIDESLAVVMLAEDKGNGIGQGIRSVRLVAGNATDAVVELASTLAVSRESFGEARSGLEGEKIVSEGPDLPKVLVVLTEETRHAGVRFDGSRIANEPFEVGWRETASNVVQERATCAARESLVAGPAVLLVNEDAALRDMVWRGGVCSADGRAQNPRANSHAVAGWAGDEAAASRASSRSEIHLPTKCPLS